MHEAAPALVTSGLNLRFGGVVALEDLDLRVRPGEVRCIIGPNGAGKTTLLNVITGMAKPDSGQILLHGEDTTGLSAVAVARRGVVRSFQTSTIFAGLSVSTNIDLGARRPSSNGATEVTDDRVEELLDALGLAHRADARAADLAHGEKKRLELAMLVAKQPRMLLLDEPTAGMGVRETGEIREFITRIRRDMTILIIEHDMAFVRGIAESVSVLHRGALLAEGSVDEVAGDPRVREVYLGGDPT